MSTRILGLDPGGKFTGFGLIEIGDGHAITVLDYGVVPVPSDTHALVAVWEWLQAYCVQDDYHIAFEELLDTKGRFPDRCPREAKEIRGVIRLFCEELPYQYKSYHPSTVRSVMQSHKKTETRDMVSRIVGMNLKGQPDHATDALAVAIVYAIRECNWSPGELAPLPATPRKTRPRKADAFAGVDFEDPANALLAVAAMEAGVLKPARRR